MRKITALLAALLAAVLLAGCGGDDGSRSFIYAAAPGSGWADDTSAAGSHSMAEEDLAAARSGDVVEIKEKMFIAQSNDIYLNPDEYMGKTILYEGIFVTMEADGQVYHYVIRYGPGCCGYDGEAGFEVAWPEGEEQPFPQDDSWVEVRGVLETYKHNGWPVLRLRITSLTEKEERGAEYVSQ